MLYHLNNIVDLQSKIQDKIEELENKKNNFEEEVNLHKIKLILRESKAKIKKYHTITRKIELPKSNPISSNSKEKIIVCLLKRHGYSQQKILQKNRQWVGNLLTCYHRLSRLSNAPESCANLSQEIKRKIIQEFVLSDRQITEVNTKARKAEKAVLFMNILGEIEKEACQDYLASIVKLQELNERIEKIFITQNPKILSAANEKNNLTLVG